MSHSNESFVRHTGSPSAPVSTSPRPASLSRPHWPWTTNVHRPASSSSSLPSMSASPSRTPHGSWESVSSSSTTTWSGAARPSPGSAGSAVQIEAGTIRQWNFTAFEWTIRNVHTLRDFVERGHACNNADGPEEPHEVLRESPVLGDGKFKLEIVRASQDAQATNTTPTPSSSPLTQKEPAQAGPNLSLCITSLLLDLAQGPEYDVSATMFAGLKVQDDREGERGARADWVWEYWEKDWSFRQDSEVWECMLPSLSSLLENPRIAETDSFIICIQIHNPVGPQYPQHPSAYYVPKDLLDGVEASLDNPHTGDVKFVCLERFHHTSDPTSPATSTISHGRRTSSETSAHSSSVPSVMARKRVLYAHSDILMNRSEYFATMFTSAFAENADIPAGERKVFEVMVEEADFVTMYWLLKWVYADWLLFKEIDDPRAAVDGRGEGWSAKWLSGRGDSNEWDWKIIGKAGIYDDGSVGSKDDDAQARSVHSTESSVAGRSAQSQSTGKGKGIFTQPPSTAAVHPSTVPSSPRGPPRMTASSAGRGSNLTVESAPSVSSRRSKSSPGTGSLTSPSTSRGPPTTPSYNYPVSPRQARQQPSVQDPHPHPTRPPPPASALSIWQVAHRYAMPGLSSLALSHMMNTLKPMNAFPLLLATCYWEDLHTLVEDYVVDQWDVACNSEEFERCCQEVAAGEWGAEGGKTLAALFRRLRSPIQRHLS